MDEGKVYRDVAVLAGQDTDDAWEALASSYEFVCRLIVAVLQRTGHRRIPHEWFELAEGFVVIADPLGDGSWKLSAVRRGEVKSDSMQGAEALRAKWDELYVRRDRANG